MHDGTIVINVNVVLLVEQKKQIITISISILEELEIFSPQGGDIGETTKEFKPNLEVVWNIAIVCLKKIGNQVALAQNVVGLRFRALVAKSIVLYCCSSCINWRVKNNNLCIIKQLEEAQDKMANGVERVEFEKHKKDWDIITLELVT